MQYRPTKNEERRVFDRYVPCKHALVMSEKCYGILKNISLGGIAMYCVNDSETEQFTSLELFLSAEGLSFGPEQFEVVSRHPTQGHAMAVNHIQFKNLSPKQLTTLWSEVKKHCQQPKVDFQGDNHSTDVSIKRQHYYPGFPPLHTNHPAIASQKSDTLSGVVSSR